MKEYETIEDFENVMEQFDNVFVEVNSDVYVDLLKVKLLLHSSTFFHKGTSKRIYFREYNRTTFNIFLDQLIKEKEQTYIYNYKYESPVDFNIKGPIGDTFVQISESLWRNIKLDLEYSRLLDVYTYGREPLEIIPLENYNKEAYESYILAKKLMIK